MTLTACPAGATWVLALQAKTKLPGNSYWAFGPKVGLRPTKDCIEEGEGKASPLQKNIFSPDYAKIKKKVLQIFFWVTLPPPPQKKKMYKKINFSPDYAKVKKK